MDSKKTVPALTFYLEMLVPPADSSLPGLDTIHIARAENISAAFYRFLYNEVGKDWTWVTRNLLGDEELRCTINAPGNEIYVLYSGGVPAGFCELDCSDRKNIELVYFGLLPEFTGKGLGKYFLQWAILKAWSYHPNRFWVHTCELDHPAALPNYLKAGFKLYDKKIVQQVIL